MYHSVLKKINHKGSVMGTHHVLHRRGLSVGLTTLMNMYNVKAFLEDGKFVFPDQIYHSNPSKEYRTVRPPASPHWLPRYLSSLPELSKENEQCITWSLRSFRIKQMKLRGSASWQWLSVVRCSNSSNTHSRSSHLKKVF